MTTTTKTSRRNDSPVYKHNPSAAVESIEMIVRDRTTTTTRSSKQKKNTRSTRHPVLARMMRTLREKRMDRKSISEHRFETIKASLATQQDGQVFGREDHIQQLLEVYMRIATGGTNNDNVNARARGGRKPQQRVGVDSSNDTRRLNNSSRNHSQLHLDHARALPEMVLIHGQCGMGKSSLVKAFVKRLSSLSIKTNTAAAGVAAALPRQSEQQYTTLKPFFVSGKFDQLKSHVPYAALLRASNDLARQVLRRPNSDEIRTKIRTELGPDINLLGNHLMQDLTSILQEDENNNYQDGESTPNKKKSQKGATTTNRQAFTKFKLLVRAFFRSVASPSAPVVLFLDDLQWADVDTLEVLQALLTDKLSKCIMIIGAYRDDEMNMETLEQFFSARSATFSQHEDTETFSVSSCSSKFRLRVTDIHVTSLDEAALNQMVSSVLNMDPSQTTSLSNVIMTKTDGNPFYALNFIDMLCSIGLLQRRQREPSLEQIDDVARDKKEQDAPWNWDIDAIIQQSDVSDNLAHILETKILRLPEKVRSILQLAAFIGHDFSSKVLATIVYAEQDMIEGQYSFELESQQVIQDWICQALSIALGEGLVETYRGDDTFKFSHDRIQQCLYKDLMPDDVERRLLHQRIGKLVLKSIESQNMDQVDDWVFFLAADNLNRGPEFVDDDEDRRELVALNLRVARLAASKAAFLVAVEYLRLGLELIAGNDAFVESNYKLCLGLYHFSAEVERTVGNYSKSNELVMEIHKRARVLDDCFPAYLTETKTLSAQGDLTGAMQLAFKVLRQLGVVFPKRITTFTVVKEFLRTKILIGGRTPKDLMKLPLLTDKLILFALELLSAICLYAFVAGDSQKLTFVAVGLRMTALTVRYGLSDLYAPQAFVGYGFVCCFFGMFSVGIAYEELAMELLSNSEDVDAVEGRTQILALSFIHPWTYGIDPGLSDGFMQGYQNAMLAGDIDYGHWGVAGWLISTFYNGMPLDQLLKKTKHFCSEMEEFGTKSQLLICCPVWQMVLNFVGCDRINTDPSILTGEAVFLPDFIKDVNDSKSAAIMFALKMCEMVLAFHFGNWNHLETVILPTVLKIYSAGDGYWLTPSNYASIGWASYRLYEQTNKRRYRRVARLFFNKVNRFASQGSPLAIVLKKLLLAADALYIQGRPTCTMRGRMLREHMICVEDLFRAAIVDLGEKNYLMHQSLACDALAEMYFNRGESEKGQQYQEQSISIYHGWGAQAKVDLLQGHVSSKDVSVKTETSSR